MNATFTTLSSLTKVVEDLREEQNQQRAALSIYSKLVDDLTSKMLKFDDSARLMSKLVATNKALRGLALDRHIGGTTCRLCNAVWFSPEESHIPGCLAEEVIHG